MQYKDHSCMPPPGSIVNYIGTSDPAGWIICDGVVRTSTDDRYEALSNLLGGNKNRITPPDLRSKFLRGNSTVISGISGGGSDTVTLTTANMPSHSHAITINETAHTHNNTISDYHNHTISTFQSKQHNHQHSFLGGTHRHGCDMNPPDDANWTGNENQNPPGDTRNYLNRFWPTMYSYTNMYFSNQTAYATATATSSIETPGVAGTNAFATTGITATSVDIGSGSSFSIIPLHRTVNYIMKY